ncbi:hypothetical protein MASR2M78_29060 [Treponema sp.]
MYFVQLLCCDNLVWDVEEIAEYARFVAPFARSARERGKRIVYFRFAKHEAVLTEEEA